MSTRDSMALVTAPSAFLAGLAACIRQLIMEIAPLHERLVLLRRLP